MKYILPILILLFIPTVTFGAFLPPYRVYYSSYVDCVQVFWSPSTGKTTCFTYDPTTKIYTNRGIGIIQEWTGKYDKNGIRIFEGDRISVPRIEVGATKPDEGVVEWGIAVYWEGIPFYSWRIKLDNNVGIYPLGEYQEGIHLKKVEVIK